MNFEKDLVMNKEKGMSIDGAIVWLKDLGASKVESIVALTKVYLMSMTEAKKLVHFHPTWKEAKKRDEKFHENLDSLFKEED